MDRKAMTMKKNKLKKGDVEDYPASRVSFDLPRQIGKRKETLLPLPDLSRKIEGDSARRVVEDIIIGCLALFHNDSVF